MVFEYDNSSFNILLTLDGMEDLRPKMFFLFLALSVYLMIIILNLTLIITIILEKSLHEPMYIFICNLCLNELYGTTGFYPRFLYDLCSSSQVILYSECMAQLTIIYTSIMCEYTTLVIMAYDRYVAICRPLEYHNTIGTQTVTKAVLYSWTFPFFIGLPNLILTSQQSLCGSHIDKLYCDNWSIVKLSCTSSTVNNIYGLFVISVNMAHAVIVLLSYQRLIAACMKSRDKKKKFIQTCGPHFLSLLNFTIAVLFDLMFSRYGSKQFPKHLRNFFQIEILVIPPLLNPLIYGLKLSGIRKKICHLCMRFHLLLNSLIPWRNTKCVNHK